MSSCTLPYCCCGCSLRTGILFAGWYGLVSPSIRAGLSSLTCFIVTSLIKGILTLYGIHTDDLSLLWVSAYFHLSLGIFVILSIVVSLLWEFYIVLVFIFDAFINFYSFLILRSFALELAEKRKNSTALCKI
ncbi:hypothetical protein Avbf_10572 [Armadillidium vulgare]|nr:hypothetical protein Avbf_10572 [Armadillidium vulgare]